MVVAVAQVQPGRRADSLHLVVASHGYEHFAERPCDPSKRQELTLQLMQSMEHLLIRINRDLAVACFQSIAIVVDDREQSVDQRIQQTVGEVIGMPCTNRCTGFLDPLPDGIEAISGAFLESKHIVLAEEQARLLGSRLTDCRHPGNNEVVRPVKLDLGTLVDVNDVASASL